MNNFINLVNIYTKAWFYLLLYIYFFIEKIGELVILHLIVKIILKFMKKEDKKVVNYNPNIEFLLYKTDNEEIKVDVLLQNENIWMSQKKMAELFDVDRTVITKHLKNIFESEELIEKWTSVEIALVQKEGTREISRNTMFYNLDAIIAVWYRVNSKMATRFRIWANKIIKEFIIKWYTMDVERLKNPTPVFWKDYFDEQLEKIRDIRSSERRFYQKITDIYAECSIDYDSKSKITQTFFATVQNKLHFSITWQTAAEIITSRADFEKDYMWLTSWKNSPNWKIRKTDVVIAKNYLKEKELKWLNRIVSMYLDYAEHQSEKGIVMKMKDWSSKLNIFLEFNEEEILEGAWKITAKIAKSFAENEYEKYKKKQDLLYKSDFDKLIEETK